MIVDVLSGGNDEQGSGAKACQSPIRADPTSPMRRAHPNTSLLLSFRALIAVLYSIHTNIIMQTNNTSCEYLLQNASSNESYRYCCTEVHCVIHTEPKVITQNWSDGGQEYGIQMPV